MAGFEEIKDNLAALRHPEIDATLEELGMIQDVKKEQGKIRLTLKLPFLYVPIRGMLEEMIEGVLKPGGTEYEIEVAEMDEAERNNFMRVSQSRWIG